VWMVVRVAMGDEDVGEPGKGFFCFGLEVMRESCRFRIDESLKGLIGELRYVR
jgi:hypothetical protein